MHIVEVFGRIFISSLFIIEGIKKILIILISGFIFVQYINVSYGASGDSSSTYSDPYKEASNFIKRAKNLKKRIK